MNLDEYLKEAKSLKLLIRKRGRQQEEARIKLLFLLVEMKGLNLVWQKDYRSWDEFLRIEALCPKSVFHRFDRAVKLLGADKVRRFGATASSTLVMTNKIHRKKLLDATEAYFKGRNPTYTEVNRFVWEKNRELQPPMKTTSRGKLLKYIKTLQDIMKKAKLEIPPFPESP